MAVAWLGFATRLFIIILPIDKKIIKRYSQLTINN